MRKTLSQSFERAAERNPGRVAVRDVDRGLSITYEALGEAAEAWRGTLEALGVGAGDRVGICAPKSIPSVAAILGTLKAGAAYVPVDVGAPVRRGATILDDCGVRVALVDPGVSADLAAASGRGPRRWDGSVPAAPGPDLEVLVADDPDAGVEVPEGLAYVLYTSGSTGVPKGVMHTHASARAFVDWAIETFRPEPDDRLTSHAPFHFDLSIFDLYVALGSGASVLLLGEETTKNPIGLAEAVAASRPTIWYSTPSALRLLVEHGRSAEGPGPRLALFAGEVFPPPQLRKAQQRWSGARWFNLYGPTETNVCTFHEVDEEVPENRVAPYPIGKPLPCDRTRVVDADGRTVEPGDEGELLVSGGTVMAGYWRRPEKTAASFHDDPDGTRWYRTGDLVREDPAGDYVFVGRRDRMVKRRGYRVELGEIEAALSHHPLVREAAVVAVADEGGELRVVAHLGWAEEGRGSIIEMKRFLVDHVPTYMIPDRFEFLEGLPRTSTDKIDYVRLERAAAEAW